MGGQGGQSPKVLGRLFLILERFFSKN